MIINETEASSLFNVHELWGIAITSIYFLIGFPTNLLSIIVCCKSLLNGYLASVKNRRLRKKQQKYLDDLFLTRKFSFIQNNNNLANGCSNFDLQVHTTKDIDEEEYHNFFPNDQNTPNRLSINNNNLEVNVRHPSLNSKTSAYGEVFSYKYTSKKSINSLFSKSFNNNIPSANLSPNSYIDMLSKKCSQNSRKIQKNLTLSKVRSNPHRKCFELYLIEISFCDLIILGYNFTEWMLLILSKFRLIDQIYMEPVLISKFMCHFIIALNRTVVLMHNWLVASMAFTRCYAIYKPLSSNTYFSSKFYYRLNLCVLLLFLIVFTSFNIYGVMFLTFYETPSNFTDPNMPSVIRECRISKEIYERYPYIEAYINITLGIVGYSLPCLITLIINLVLIYNISHISFFKGKRLSNWSKNGTETSDYRSSIEGNSNELKDKVINKKRNQFYKTSSSLLTISFAYLICYLPYSFLFLLLSLHKITMNGDIIFVLSFLRYLNHSINFFIYFATGKRFRNDVVKFLRLKK